MAATDDQPNSSFLPDLCSTRAVLVVVVVAELMALVINLVATYYSDFSVGRLAITSLFVQWVGLTSAALVCQLRSRLNRLAPAWASWVYWSFGGAVPPQLRKWRNWQTRRPQEPVGPSPMGVQVPPSAPSPASPTVPPP